MNRSAQYVRVVPLVLWTSVASAEQPRKPIPPSLSFDKDPADVLHEYPPGTITRQEVFAHHGSPIHTVALPNGEKGWWYLAGEEAGIPDIHVLGFPDDGIVIDVLHKSYRYRIGHSALQYRYLHHVDADVPHPAQCTVKSRGCRGGESVC